MKNLSLAAFAAFVLASAVFAQIPTLTTQVVGNSATNGLTQPLFVCAPPGDLTRLFVVQKNGLIKVRTPANAAGVWGTFLNIQTLVSGGSEQGLLGLAFHPNYAGNGYFFVNYTNTSGNTVVARYQVSANPDVANAASATTVLTISQPYSNHNGGCLQFGPDGYLYIGTGDGGSGNDPQGNGQNVNTLLGKMLRINVDTLPYTNPPTNPFYGGTAGLDEIWAYGYRNPWRFSFDRLTGDMWVGDVGQDTQEEINFQPATNGAGLHGGRNYGWRCREGNTCTGLSGCTCSSGTLTNPVHTFSTQAVGNVSVIGGYVYRGCAIPQLRGWYVFGEYGAGSVSRLLYNGTSIVSGPTSIGFTVSNSVSYGEDGNGELHVCSMTGNTVYKIVPATPQLVGATSYGSGTPGCNGASVLSLGCSPTIYNPGETVKSTNGPAGTTGIMILGNTSLPPGSDPLSIGVEVLVGLAPMTYSLLEFPVGPGGLTTLPAAIPNTPSLVGATFYTQQFFAWTSCSPSPLNLSSTQGLMITIQP